MGNSFRVDRVGMEIKREVNEILQKKVRDPRVQDVTITDVQMLGDLSAAKIFYQVALFVFRILLFVLSQGAYVGIRCYHKVWLEKRPY